MKAFLLLAGLAAGLAGCNHGSNPAPAPADPLLGHWQTQSVRSIVYEASTGQVRTDQTSAVSSTLDITATTITFTSVVNGRTSVETDPYTRSGSEQLLITPASGNTGGETYFARNLTSSTFTLEYVGPRTAGRPTYYVQSSPYRR